MVGGVGSGARWTFPPESPFLGVYMEPTESTHFECVDQSIHLNPNGSLLEMTPSICRLPDGASDGVFRAFLRVLLGIARMIEGLIQRVLIITAEPLAVSSFFANLP